MYMYTVSISISTQRNVYTSLKRVEDVIDLKVFILFNCCVLFVVVGNFLCTLVLTMWAVYTPPKCM